jgi:Low-density lipoprotein receptor domain class A
MSEAMTGEVTPLRRRLTFAALVLLTTACGGKQQSSSGTGGKGNAGQAAGPESTAGRSALGGGGSSAAGPQGEGGTQTPSLGGCVTGRETLTCVQVEGADAKEVAARSLCDGFQQCLDGSDELDSWCACSLGYRCEVTGTRIARRNVCDGVHDCPQGDDEPCSKPVPACPKHAQVVADFLDAQPVCAIRELGDSDFDFSFAYRCSSGAQIQPSRRCNGVADCPDGDDEAGCPIACEKTCTTSENLTTCSGPPCEFYCADGSTILQDAVCDGTAQCAGGDDELCVDRFVCYKDPRRSGVAFARVCDGDADCPSGEDEDECPPASHFFVCDDGNQILFPYFSAGCRTFSYPLEPHCADGSAPYLPCPNPG